MPAVSDLGEALATSFAAALAVFFTAIPKIIAFAVILIVGWIVASVLANVVARVLRSVNFNDFARRAGLSDFVQRMGVNMDASGLIAQIAKWFVFLVFMVVAFDALGLPAVSEVVQQFLAFLPNLVVALVVLVIGGLAANALSRVVRGATSRAGLGNPDLLATVATAAVWAFAIVIAVNQLGIATTLVNTLFMGVVGAVALALGLAFGLGGRETAAQIVQSWYQRSREVGPQVARVAEAAREEMREQREAREGRVRDETERMEPSGDGRPIRRTP